jgi:glyoxylate/hydroxypyruvate reductase A
VLGRAVLDRLGTFGFERLGWSRSPKSLHGVTCHAGQDALQDFLHHCDILVCLLPLTPQTRGILDERLFAALPRGAAIVNVARGANMDGEALVAALDSGQVSAAILDVTDPEPLPAGHRFWRHPRILLTPHVASMTLAVIDNVRRCIRGEPLSGRVDRRQGY